MPTEQRDALQTELAKCAAGACSCPPTHYAKLQSIQVTPSAEGFSVNLLPKSGETVDRNEVERCLEHTAVLIQR